METYHGDFTADTCRRDLLQILTTETYCEDLWKGIVEGIRILCKVCFLMPIPHWLWWDAYFVLVYHRLPLTTIDLVGNNRKFEV